MNSAFDSHTHAIEGMGAAAQSPTKAPAAVGRGQEAALDPFWGFLGSRAGSSLDPFWTVQVRRRRQPPPSSPFSQRRSESAGGRRQAVAVAGFGPPQTACPLDADGSRCVSRGLSSAEASFHARKKPAKVYARARKSRRLNSDRRRLNFRLKWVL